jgi:guanylate kinase
LIVIISGPSGVGKGTIVREILTREPYLFSVSVSLTTRAPRPNETDGTDYFFVSDEEFKKHMKNGDFLEFNEYCGNLYGTLASEAEKAGKNGKCIILEIEPRGAVRISKKNSEYLAFFIMPPSREELTRRLLDRNTENPEEVSARLKRFDEELEISKSINYNYIMNYNWRQCAEEIIAEVKKNIKG